MFPFSPLFSSSRPLIGMVHLAPLPGSPRWGGSVAAVIDRACQDARVLAEAGIDGIIVENFGDTPFAPGRVEAVTVAAMTVATRAVRDTVSSALSVGVNVLRADTRSAIAIAMVTGAVFVRTNVLTGALVTDQGIIQGDAYAALRERRSMGAEVSLLADVLSKHAAPIAHGQTLELEARAIAYRGLADALIVTGDETADPTRGADLRRVKAAVPDRPVLIGSGLDETNIAELLPLAVGAIL
ncbi:MAG: BtpA/SgcQ family protein, partial [Chloroflexi bacterium]|nr:BtpA/SgcQ family protein [Chloroflexota bacterium]